MSSIQTIYYQGGATFPVQPGKRATKTALKRAIKEEPHSVFLYDTTAPILGGPKWTGMANELPEGTTFNVVGPDPFTRRDWYASVYRNRTGGLTVR